MSEGKVVSIYTAPAATAPMSEQPQAQAVAGKGLEGDRYFSGTGTFWKPQPDRELTLIEIEAIEALERDYDLSLAPGRVAPEHRHPRRGAEPLGGPRVPSWRSNDARNPALRTLRPPPKAHARRRDKRADASRWAPGADPYRGNDRSGRLRGGGRSAERASVSQAILSLAMANAGKVPRNDIYLRKTLEHRDTVARRGMGSLWK